MAICPFLQFPLCCSCYNILAIVSLPMYPSYTGALQRTMNYGIIFTMKENNIIIAQLPLSKNDRQAVEEFVQRLRIEFLDGIREIKLFGSKIRKGVSTTKSDIDILVIVKDNKNFITNKIIDIAFEINLKYDIYISPRILPEAVFKNTLWRATPFIQNLEKEAVAI